MVKFARIIKPIGKMSQKYNDAPDGWQIPPPFEAATLWTYEFAVIVNRLWLTSKKMSPKWSIEEVRRE